MKIFVPKYDLNRLLDLVVPMVPQRITTPPVHQCLLLEAELDCLAITAIDIQERFGVRAKVPCSQGVYKFGVAEMGKECLS